MCDNFQTWQNVLVQWVNCLALQDTPVQQIKELGDGRFFHNLLNVISIKAKRSINTDQVNEEVTTFLKYEYPHYCMDAESCEVEDVVEITYITSLLLLHCVLKSQNKKIMDQMYNLDTEIQVSIKNFFEIVLHYEGNVTRSALKHAISEYGNNISPKATEKGNHCSESPLIGFSTPKRPPIKDVVESPLAQKLKQLSEQRAAIKRLNNELELEQTEKVEMQEELRQQHEKTKKLAKQLIEKNEEIKKLREEWLYSNSETHKNGDCGKSCQEVQLKNEIKSLETYVSSIHVDMDALHNERDLLQQRLSKAEHQYNVWHTKSEEYEAQCEKLQHNIVEKELELANVKELCSELQSHVQGLKEVRDISVEDDSFTLKTIMSPPVFRTAENLGQVVVDLQLHEKEEENKIMSKQLKKMIMEEEEMTKYINDLEIRLKAANSEAGSLKTSNLELERKVDKMATLQLELEESERKLNSASVELDHLCQERTLLEKELAGLQDLLACKDDELLESHNAAQSLTSDLTKLQDKFLETQNVLTAEVERVVRLELDSQETQRQLECRSQEFAAMKIENVEAMQNLDFIGQQLGENVRQAEEMLLSSEDTSGNVEQLREDRIEESLSALCLSVKGKVQRLNFLLTELNVKNLKSLYEKSNLESACKQLNESIIKLRREIAELEEKEQKHLLERSMLEECLQRADENISVLQTKMLEYTHKIEDLNTALEDKKVVVGRLESVKQSLSDENEKLEKLGEEKAEKLQKVETELAVVKQDKVLVEDQYSKIKEFSEEQTKFVNVLNCKIAELEKQIQDLVQERDFSNNNLQNIISKLQELQASKENLEQIYNNAMQENKESIDKLNGHANILKDRINELENKVALADEELEYLKENVAELSKNRDILKLQYDAEIQEKGEQIELHSQHVRKLEATVVELEEEKKVVVGELKCVKLNLSEIETKNEVHIEKLNEHLLEKEEYIKNFRTTMENELTRLEHEKETVNSVLEIVKAELLEVTANKDEIKMLYEKQNEDYKTEFTNLSDKLTSLASEIEAMEQDKMATHNELQSKTNELTDFKRSYETLLEGTEQLKTTNEKQLEQLKMSIKRVEEMAKKNKIITEELNIASSELSKEKQCKELLSEELSEKNNNLVSLVQESDNLHNVVKILEEERNLLQNTVQRLTTEIMNVEASKDKLMQVYSTSETEREKIVAVRMELEIKMDSLENEKASISNDLCAAKSDLALHKEQQENIIVAHNKKIEEKEDTITQLMRKASLLQDEVNSLEAERKDLCTELQTVNSELSKLKTCQEHASQLCNKMEAENEALELAKISLDKKIEELLHEKNCIIKELETVRVLVQELQENKVLLLEQHSKELHEREEKIDGILKDKAALQNLLDQTTEELNVLNRNLQSSESELLEIKRSQDELLEAHTKQIQETEENIMSAHRNAVEVKAVLLKKVEEVEGERDMEKKLRAKVEQLLNEEKKNMESVLSQMNVLMSEKMIISQLCSDFKDNVCSLRVNIAALQEQNINKKEEADNQEIVISTTEHFDGMNKESEHHETESSCVLYDSKKKLPAKPWNLDPIIDLVNVCNGNEQGSDSILSENSSGLQNLCVEAHIAPLDAKPAAMKILVPVMEAEDEDKTGTNLSEAVNKLEGLNAELDSARTEIMGVLKSNDNLRNELAGSEKKCSDMVQKYTNLEITNGILKSENEKLLENIKELENVKSLLDRSERDLTIELNAKAELRTEKDTLEAAYGVLKGDNETLNTTVDIMNNQIESLHKQNLELNETLQKYERSHLKCEEECWKLVRIREERELEFKKLLDSETSLKQKMFEFQSSLKDLNYKFETLVSGTPISCKELRVIERQRIELEELFTLMDIECEEISQSILNCTYDSLKQAEKNIENQCLLLGIAVHLVANEQPETDLNLERENECDVAGSIDIENKKRWQELDVLQLQISTLISGIEIAMKKCISVDAQSNQILEMYKTKTEIAYTFNQRSVRGLCLKDRTNLIKDIVTKLQGSEKKHVKLEMEEDGWNPEDLLEMDSVAKCALKEVSQKENDKKQASQQSSILKMRLRLEQELAQKTKEIEHLNMQNTSLKAMLQEEQNLKAEMKENLTELRALHETLAGDKEIACKLKSAEEQKCLQLELELQKTSEIKQAYETLLEVNYKLQMENDDMESKIEEKIKAIRQEYEKKLDRLKAKMRVLYEEEIEKKMKKPKEEIEQFQAMCRLYKDKIESYENDVGILKSQVWEIGDKLLMTEREKKKLEEDLSKQQIFLQSNGKQDYFAERRETLSNLERGRKVAASSREMPTMDVIDESITFVRRKKNVSRQLPSGMGLMFDPEDEEGEVFNTTNLADLKAGRCVPRDYKGRISELQYRNSLCPPHLKSSYPAETQFHHPHEYRDEDLKLGCAVEVDQCDALGTSLLLPSEKQRKRDRGQTSYQKPGPPTPGKNGGRLSLQGTEVLTPRAPLRESNDGACVRKASTPSRLKSLFTNKNRRDEVRWVVLLYSVLLTTLLGLIFLCNFNSTIIFEI